MRGRRYTKYWPKDRIARFQALRAAAAKAGVSIKIKDHGNQLGPLFLISASNGAGRLGLFSDVDEAERWLGGQLVPEVGP
jgi:hypothetical protein